MPESMKKGHVAVVSATPVYPCTQGNRRVIKQLLEWLRQEGYATIFLHQTLSESQTLRSLHASLCDEYVSTRGLFMLRRLRLLTRGLLGRIRRMRVVEPNNCWPETKRLLKNIVNRHSCRAVVAEYHFMTPVFDVVPAGVLKIVQTHDACSLVKNSVGNKGVDTQGREISAEEERNRLKRADVIIAIQKKEREYFSRLIPERTVIEIGYAMPADAGTGSDRRTDGKRILFVGGPNPLNKRGIELFMEHGWPLVQKEHRTAKLAIAGGVCSDLEPSESGQIELKGVLEDLEDEWARATVVINPVGFGTGLKIKTVEALAKGKAFVTTTEGGAGLISENRPFLVADDWALFAKHVNDLLSDQFLRKEYEQRARAYAETHLTHDIVYSPLKEMLDKRAPQCAQERNQNREI